MTPIRHDALSPLVEAWLAEYGDASTQRTYREGIGHVIRWIGATQPADLSAARVAAYAESCGLANNTVRSRVNPVRLFLTWCHEMGHTDSYRDRPYQRIMQSFPMTYDKVQGKRPPARLNRTQLDRLVAACQDGTHAGLRDEVAIRLTVTGGMRSFELLALNLGDLETLTTELTWTGKRNKVRTAGIGDDLRRVIAKFVTTYRQQFPDAAADTPAFCPKVNGRFHRGRLVWGKRMSTTAWQRVLERRAQTAGLPHVAPHDLKRTTARILHEARSDDGGHLFDLADIADVLDHSNPKVTKDCYIGPLSNANKQRAAGVLD